jgi:hypothetical protein
MMDVQTVLDRLVPEPARTSAWDDVLRDARPHRRSLTIQLAVATGIAAFAALFVVAPWQGSERVGILDRALAAAGDGPVLHVVFRGGWGGTLVDLKTGERKPIYGEREVWYDPARDLVHYVSRFGGVVQNEEQFRRKTPDRELKALWQQYRSALESGTARIVGEDVIGGTPVYWVIVWRQMLPDVEDHKLHEFAQQVAISRETFEPVAMKYTRDRQTADPRGIEHILRYETVSVGEADFTSPPEASLEGIAMSMGNKPIAIEQAREILGRTPLWLGERFAGLPLVQAEKASSAAGRQERTPLTGKRGAQIRRCLQRQAARAGRKPGREPCLRRLRRFGGIVSIGGELFETGRVKFGPEHSGVTFFYGTVGDDPGTFKKGDLVPLWSEPHVVLTQTTDRELITRGSTTKYEAPAGSVLLMPGPSGSLVRDGLYVSILAESEKLILDAARALEPMG